MSAPPFSARTRWDRTANRLSRILDEQRRSGAPVLDLTESNPTRAGFMAPADLLAALATPASALYEPQPAGLESARRAVAADYARRGISVEPSRILLTASTSEAYAHLFKLLCDPGDAVLVPRPSYPLFDFLATLESVEVHRYPLRWDGEWHLSVAALAEAVTPRTRAVVVVHPNNPTGSYLKRDEAHGLLALCAERGLALVADEVFADYALRDDPRRASSAAEEGPALAFALGGLSKSCALPQLKLGWIVASGPRRLRDEALARLEIVADTYLSVSTPVQHAAPAILARLPELQRPIAERLGHHRDLVRARVAGSAATLLEAEGGWYATLRVPATVSEEERTCRLLEAHGVLVHPGFFFDFENEAFLVLSLLPPTETFSAGLDRILADLVL
jgi:aspartate/methionine/tyrosine aminotransferase